MKIVFLGTNGWYDTEVGNTVCTLIDSRDCYVIFDAGDGIHKAKEYITENKPIYLFLSHLHLDHISGFHIFPAFMQDKKLYIILQKGNAELLRNIARNPYMIPLGDNVIFHEVADGKHQEPLKFECLGIKHVDPTVGFRIILEDKIIAYCLDTGICDNVVKLSKEADILITECSMIPGTSNQEWGHLNPEEAAGMAKEANVKRMVMTHVSVNGYKSYDERKNAERMAQKIFKNSLIADDDLIIEL